MGWRGFCRSVVSLLLLGAAAAGLLLYATPWGLGLGGDSYYYVSGAEGLAAGEGYTRLAADGTRRPITHFPPLYSAALAVASRVWGGPLQSARVLHAVLFGLNMALVGWHVRRGTGSEPLGFAGAALFGFSGVMLAVHAWLLSEALFLSLVLLSTAAAAEYLETGRHRWKLAVGAAAAGLAALTRYVGVALALSQAVVLLSYGGRTCRRKRTDAVLWLALALAGLVAWASLNALTGASVTNRIVSLHFPAAEKWSEACLTVGRWLLPLRVAGRIGCVLTLGLLVSGGIATAWRLLPLGARSPTPGDSVLVSSVMFGLVYALLLGFSLVFFDASTPLDDRILSPLYIFGLVAGIGLLAPAAARRGLPRLVLAVALGGLLAMTSVRCGLRVSQLRQDGMGYASKAWRDSRLVGWVLHLPAHVSVYTNELDAIYLLTGRQAYQIPIWWDPVRAAPREDFEQQLAGMRTHLVSGEAVLVLFDTLSSQQAFFPPQEQLVEGIPLVFRAPDGAVYGVER